MALKFIDSTGNGTDADAAAAILYAADARREGRQRELGRLRRQPGSCTTRSRRPALEGMVFVAGAGNDGIDTDASPFFPAVLRPPERDLRRRDRRRTASSPRPPTTAPQTVDLGAPGTGIETTLPNNTYGLRERHVGGDAVRDGDGRPGRRLCTRTGPPRSSSIRSWRPSRPTRRWRARPSPAGIVNAGAAVDHGRRDDPDDQLAEPARHRLRHAPERDPARRHRHRLRQPGRGPVHLHPGARHGPERRRGPDPLGDLHPRRRDGLHHGHGLGDDQRLEGDAGHDLALAAEHPLRHAAGREPARRDGQRRRGRSRTRRSRARCRARAFRCSR